MSRTQARKDVVEQAELYRQEYKKAHPGLNVSAAVCIKEGGQIQLIRLPIEGSRGGSSTPNVASFDIIENQETPGTISTKQIPTQVAPSDDKTYFQNNFTPTVVHTQPWGRDELKIDHSYETPSWSSIKASSASTTRDKGGAAKSGFWGMLGAAAIATVAVGAVAGMMMKKKESQDDSDDEPS